MFPHFTSTDPAVLAALADHVSAERMSTYTALTRGNVARALHLYDWNIALSSAFSADLQRFEVILRNALHVEASAVFGAAWWDTPGLLSARSCDDIRKARGRMRRSETPGRVLAELNLGFWRFLLSSHYERTLWTPALRKAFPHLRPAKRREVERCMTRLHEVRNRIAHCEPILGRRLDLDHRDLITVTGWISPQASAWVQATTLVPQLLKDRPT